MTQRPQLRFWIDTGLGLISAVALVMTITMPDWIERFLGLAPDRGDGSSEWGLAISLAVATVLFFADARRLRPRSAQCQRRQISVERRS